MHSRGLPIPAPERVWFDERTYGPDRVLAMSEIESVWRAFTLGAARYCQTYPNARPIERMEILELHTFPPNEWGDSIVITVRYSDKGYCSSLGGRIVGRDIKWQCYAD